jgi:hypothetical protein
MQQVQIEKAQIKAKIMYAIIQRLGGLTDYYESLSDLEDEVQSGFEQLREEFTIEQLLHNDFEIGLETENSFFYQVTEETGRTLDDMRKEEIEFIKAHRASVSA